jgi:DNA (cytosine-5)-methyltransferase 1
MSLSAIELCAGGGGQALGLEMAGFHHEALVEYEPQFCRTLRENRPQWNTLQLDIRNFQASAYSGVDLLAGGVPCPPFSVAGKQMGADDERDMFPAALNIVECIKPRAVMFENVPGLASAKFETYRAGLISKLLKMGYVPKWQILQAANYGVPQLRPRFVLVALRPKDAECFQWPTPVTPQVSVGQAIVDLMGQNGWSGAEQWAFKASRVAPTIVGGSKKHGGPDLGPTRAKKQWRELGVDAMGIADSAPAPTFPEHGLPRLTLRMVARLQSFPDSWTFSGGKTAAYRQVGNAFPPTVAKRMGLAIASAIARANVSFGRTRRTTDGELALLEKRQKYKTLRVRKNAS